MVTGERASATPNSDSSILYWLAMQKEHTGKCVCVCARMHPQNGTLKIVDRKKHIFKLAQGEYIAPEKIENVYIRSDAVAQAFVHGDSLQVRTTARTCLYQIWSTKKTSKT